MAESLTVAHSTLAPLPAPYYVDVVRLRTGTTVRVVVSGELDLASSPCLRSEIQQIHNEDAEIVVLDLQRVTFIDSTGLYALLDAHEELNSRLRVMLSPVVARLLDLTGLRDQLPIIDDDPQTRPERNSNPSPPAPRWL